MSWYFTNLFAAFLLPPLNLLLISASGLLLWHVRPRISRFMLSISFLLLWLLSTPFIADSLLHTLEGNSVAVTYPDATQNDNNPKIDAIIVLSGGSYFNAPEYRGDTVSSASLQRLRYAAKLYRDFKIPILLAGGAPLGQSLSEAELMKHVLEQEFHTPVQWIEDKSNNTLDSARYSYRLLHKSAITRIYLVTHAWHMPRSLQAFQAAGFEVIPAPTLFTTRYQDNLLTFLPNANALQNSQIYLHEVIGMLWYRLKS